MSSLMTRKALFLLSTSCIARQAFCRFWASILQLTLHYFLVVCFLSNFMFTLCSFSKPCTYWFLNLTVSKSCYLLQSISSLVLSAASDVFDVQCIWGRIFESFEKIFVFKYQQTIFHLGFMSNIYGQSVTRTSWVH